MKNTNTQKKKTSDKYSLDYIIKKVLDDEGIEYETSCNDSNIVSLKRSFERLIERLGSNKEVFRQGKTTYEFEEAEIPFMKALLTQLYDGEGIISDFTNSKKYKKFSSKEVNEFLNILLCEAEKAESEERKEEIEDMWAFFSNLFLWSPLRSTEVCHNLIDALASNLSDIPVDRQSEYMGRVEHILKKEFALRIAESTAEIMKLAEKIETSKKENKDDIGIQNYYYESNPEIRFHYMQRDKRVLEAIQEDDDLRQYIEKKFGKKAEEIFNYAALDM